MINSNAIKILIARCNRLSRAVKLRFYYDELWMFAEKYKSCSRYWTAGRRKHDDSGEFVWKPYAASDEAVTFTYWADDQPDFAKREESCLAIEAKTQFHWNDLPCWYTEPCYLCQLNYSYP